MKTQVGRLIVIEGPDGVGKTRIVHDLVNVLKTNSQHIVSLSFPGREPGTLGSLVYSLHHKLEAFGLNTITPAALQTLHIAAHLDTIETRIKPLLNQGTTVVLDRFWWSTLVYGTVAGIERSTLEHLIAAENSVWYPHIPKCLILLDRQSSLRPEPSRDWEKLKAAYARLAKEEQTSFPVHRVCNDGEPTETLDNICQILAEDLAN
ncbi:MAG: hypothetical protein JNN17_18195 [Verrucomicrobiaceae bacterium]|nr:hypothetical protein [Verrucomicrobiaceae bacterium]